MAQTIDHYKGLVISQYQNSPKFMAWLESLLSILNDASACIASIDAAFDIDQAVGDQLDTLGDIVGFKRTVPFDPSNNVSPILDDFNYRRVLKFQIGINKWDGQIASIQTLWNSLFPEGTVSILDNQDMSIDITFASSLPSIIQDMITQGLLIPRPEGVLTNFTFIATVYFGYDYNTSTVKGYDHGVWA
jgi:hypothetical protein